MGHDLDFGPVGWNVTPSFTDDVGDYYTFTPYNLESIKISFDADSVGNFVSILGAIPISGVSKVEGAVVGTWYGGVHTEHYEISDNPGPLEPDFRPTPDRSYVENGAEGILSFVKGGGINRETGLDIDWSETTWSDNEFPSAEAVWYLTGEPVVFRFFGLEGRGTTAEIDAKNNVPVEANYDFKIFPKSGSTDSPTNPGTQQGNTTVNISSISGSALNRGDGKDTVTVAGNRADHSITNINIASNSITIDGKTITNVERLAFSDGTLALDDEGIAGQAYRIYKAAFARTPDNDGLSYWIGEMDGAVALLQVSTGFIGSAEFKSVYGTNPSGLEIVARLYQNVFGRDGESAGIAYWVGEVDSGRQSIAQILVGFSESPENVTGVAPGIADGIFYA
ncbi:MAG: DUF4214 domain-containing protein [Hoeflea sp.]|nr:DUF4214 domain-containing protein [Hoeflea sp.]